MRTLFSQELHSQVTLSGVGMGHKKWLLPWERWEARQELPLLLARLALKEGKGHVLLACPAGVCDLVTSSRALEVTVKDSCWQWESREFSEADTLQYNAQLLFFPVWQLICQQHGDGDAPCDHKAGVSWSSCKPQPSHEVTCSHCCPQSCLTSSPMLRAMHAGLTALHHQIRSRKNRKSRSFGKSIPESAICTHFFSTFVPLMTIQEQAKEIPETS